MKSREQDILSDIENLDIMLGGNHFEGEKNEDNNLTGRAESISYMASENIEENLYSNTRENRSSNNANLVLNSLGTTSSAELNKLSSELNSTISREMDEMMNSVSVQIQRAINDAISNHVLPQIQNAFRAGSGHVTQKGNVPAEIPEINYEDIRNDKMRSNSRSEPIRNRLNDELTTAFLKDKYHEMVLSKWQK